MPYWTRPFECGVVRQPTETKPKKQAGARGFCADQFAVLRACLADAVHFRQAYRAAHHMDGARATLHKGCDLPAYMDSVFCVSV